MFFPAPTCGPIFSPNETGCKPMSEGNAMAGRRTEHAWARQQETAATADTLSWLIGLQPVAFWEKSRKWELEKTLRVIILLFM